MIIKQIYMLEYENDLLCFSEKIDGETARSRCTAQDDLGRENWEYITENNILVYCLSSY